MSIISEVTCRSTPLPWNSPGYATLSDAYATVSVSVTKSTYQQTNECSRKHSKGCNRDLLAFDCAKSKSFGIPQRVGGVNLKTLLVSPVHTWMLECPAGWLEA